MDQLNQLTKTLNVLKKLSEEIISTMLPLMKELEVPDNDLVDELLEEQPDIDRAIAIKTLQDISLELVTDAQTSHSELELFSEAVTLGEDGLTEGENEYPFLFEVWCGDMYGESGVKGLQALVFDLKKQLAKINRDFMIERAISQLKK